jgi:large subunit ribosomal protein L23
MEQKTLPKPKPQAEVKKEAKTGKKPSGNYNPWNTIKYVHMAEKSMNMVEKENKITFMVNGKADKNDVKKAVERAFNVRVESVNIENTQKNEKKAYVKLSPESKAIDIATKMGMI